MKYMTGLYDQMDDKIRRPLTVSCVDVDTGSYVLFDETSPEIIKAVLSSASIPAVFPH